VSFPVDKLERVERELPIALDLTLRRRAN